MSTPNKILVAVDYGPLSSQALSVALGAAKTFLAKVEVLHVCTMPYAVRSLRGSVDAPDDNAEEPTAGETNLYQLVRSHAVHEMRTFLAAHAQECQGVSVEYSVLSGEPQRAISERAMEWGADLVIVGSHGRRAVARWFLGSVAEFTVRRCPCPVLVVPGRDVT